MRKLLTILFLFIGIAGFSQNFWQKDSVLIHHFYFGDDSTFFPVTRTGGDSGYVLMLGTGNGMTFATVTNAKTGLDTLYFQYANSYLSVTNGDTIFARDSGFIRIQFNSYGTYYPQDTVPLKDSLENMALTGMFIGIVNTDSIQAYGGGAIYVVDTLFIGGAGNTYYFPKNTFTNNGAVVGNVLEYQSDGGMYWADTDTITDSLKNAQYVSVTHLYAGTVTFVNLSGDSISNNGVCFDFIRADTVIGCSPVRIAELNTDSIAGAVGSVYVTDTLFINDRNGYWFYPSIGLPGDLPRLRSDGGLYWAKLDTIIDTIYNGQLFNVNFVSATNARITYATITNGQFTNVTITDAKITDAEFANVTITGAIGDAVNCVPEAYISVVNGCSPVYFPGGLNIVNGSDIIYSPPHVSGWVQDSTVTISIGGSSTFYQVTNGDSLVSVLMMDDFTFSRDTLIVTKKGHYKIMWGADYTPANAAATTWKTGFTDGTTTITRDFSTSATNLYNAPAVFGSLELDVGDKVWFVVSNESNTNNIIVNGLNIEIELIHIIE
jgi:hypothetical protein